MKPGHEVVPKVSVIIPVYNTAPYLRRCLDSVYGQTLRDIEIICVDDASTDNSLEILREYERNDYRVKVIDFPENRGVSVARNVGIDMAAGEYIGFVDSDDYVGADFYEKLYGEATESGAEVVKTLLEEESDDMKQNVICNKSYRDLHEKVRANIVEQVKKVEKG